MEKKSIVDGHTVSYDSNMESGIHYLMYVINAAERKVFFDEAYARGHSVFRDNMGYNYKLVHSGSEYQLARA